MELTQDLSDLNISEEVADACPQNEERTKKKNRRKPRSKRNRRPNVEEIPNNDNSDPVLDPSLQAFKIEAVKCEKTGKVIHTRNVNCQEINLESFTNNDVPYTFTTPSTSKVDDLGTKLSKDHRKISRKKFNVQNCMDSQNLSNGYTPTKNQSKNAPSNNAAGPSKAANINKCTHNENHFSGNQTNLNKSNDVNNDTLQSNGTPKRKKQQRQRKNSEKTPEKQMATKFEDYYDEKTIVEGLKTGLFVEGIVRINPKFFTEAYVSNADRSVQDYYIASVAERNRALEGDLVVLKIKPENEWRDNQKKAEVVYIKEKVHPRVAVGFLSMLRDKDKLIATLQPRDKRVPRLNVEETSLPQNFFKNPKAYENNLFMVQILDWTNPKFASGMITENVGKSNELKAETKALLLENELDFLPFPQDIQQFLPKSKEIPQTEFVYREDLRDQCIFTIDPLTARDLDDAVSCKKLPSGNFEIGVHIADVAFHLPENTKLDHLVRKKATTIYLVDNVYHMLPPELCMHCSLLPGKDNLAFSVIWEMSPDGDIIKKRFARTIINSCTKFAYEHAQEIIDNPTAELDATKFPQIHNGYDLNQIKTIVNDLQSIALKLSAKRTENGALRINQIKLGFSLDPKGEPLQYHVHAIKAANRLIEEFMLLANISVAEKIYAEFPALAFLRCHDEPNIRLLTEVKKNLEVLGIHINVDSSEELHTSLEKYNTNDYLGFTRYTVLNNLLAKPMTRARYFCANSEDSSTFYHYALSVPIYTHFTSPIRRYPDIMVHRLLAACCGYAKKPEWVIDTVMEIAANCNKQKFNAKKAGEASCDLYLAHYVEKNQPFIRDGVVVAVQEKTFDVIILETGSTVRLYINNFGQDIKYNSEQYGEGDKKLWRFHVIFPQTTQLPATLQVIEMFQIVKISLKRKEKTHKLDGVLIRPSHIQLLNKTI